MQELLGKEADPRAAEAIALFCYQARKLLGSLAALLSGLDKLVFTAGIGDNAPPFEAASAKAWSFSALDWITRLTALMRQSSLPKAASCESV
jgi:acetate kinase